MKSVLVTGGAGFIGYHLSSFLAEQGYQVTICDNLSRTKGIDKEMSNLRQRRNVDFVQLDLTEREEWTRLEDRYDVVYHLAAINGTRFFYEIPDRVMYVNLQCTLNLVQWLKNASVGKVLFASTSELYAGASDAGLLKFPTTEESPILFTDPKNPRWSYAASKFVGELLVIHSKKTNPFRWSVVRYHNIYGPKMGFEHVIPEFYMRLSHNPEKLEIIGANNQRCFCYIDDAVRATVAVAETGKTDFEILNVGNNKEEVTIRELGRRICDLLKIHPNIIERQAPLGSTLRRVPDLEKLRKLTGFEATVALDEGLSRTISWYRLNGSDFMSQN